MQKYIKFLYILMDKMLLVFHKKICTFVENNRNKICW